MGTATPTVSADQRSTESTGAPPSRIRLVGAKMLRGLRSIARVALLPALVAVGVAIAYRNPEQALDFATAHTTIVLWVVLPPVVPIWWMIENSKRKAVLRDPEKMKKAKKIKPPLRSLTRAIGEWIDLYIFQDKWYWRLIYAGMTALAIYTPLHFAVPADALTAPQHLDAALVGKSVAGPLAWFLVLTIRFSVVGRKRQGSIALIHGIAREFLKYPKPPRVGSRPDPETLRLHNPHLAVTVREWDSATVPRRWSVAIPSSVSVSDEKTHKEFEANVNARLDNPEGWHFVWRTNGTRVDVEPAGYPLSVLWDGQYDPDPLTFLIGQDLDQSGEWSPFTFGDVSPHAGIAGATGSGKTSFAELICAQAAIKPMPWSLPDDPLYARCHVIDPKGPLANRWQNRPNTTVSNGVKDIVTDDGEEVNGIKAMALHMESIWNRVQERSTWLNAFPGAANWLDVDPETLARDRIVPEFILLDEFLDHTGDDVDEGNAAAKQRIVYLSNEIARKGRAVGFHMMAVAQNINMSDMGGTLVRQLVARVYMGNPSDENILGRMFGHDTSIPNLPTHRLVDGKKKGIPGRGMLMNAGGQPVHRMQIAWFGDGSTGKNIRTLDKHLPRTTPEATPTPEPEPDPEPDPESAEPSTAVEPTPDETAIFPTANAEEPQCHYDGCVDDAARACHACGSAYCEYHLGHPADPDDPHPYCRTCQSKHPLSTSGAADIYRHMWDKSREAGLTIRYTYDDDNPNQVKITTRTQADKKVIEAAVDNGTIAARSARGTASADEATAMIDEVLDRYIEHKGQR